ncbi:MAG: transporter substrate-binding domain-containing protein [Oscillospiraceae bacterium]
MKKIFSVLAAAAMIITAAGCSSNSGSSAAVSDAGASDAADSSFKIEKLRVGSDVAYPPFEYYDTDGVTPIGVDMELAEALGEKLGCEVEIVNTAWDGIFAGLSKGDYDVVISAVTITAERLIDFDFSDPYIENWQSIVVMSDAAVKPADPSELAGLRVGYQEDTTSDIYLTDFIDKNGITVDTYEYATVMNAYDDLAAGRLDAVISDSTVATKYIAEERYEQSWIQTEGEPELFGVCMPKGSADLQKAVNDALAEMKTDGTLDKIFNTYF